MTTSAIGFAKLLLLLVIWGSGSVVLHFIALLSTSDDIINAMHGVAAICLVASLILFFTDRHPAAFLVAAGPYLTFGSILATSAAWATAAELFR